MRKMLFATTAIAALLLVAAAICPAGNLDADEIVRRANHAAMYQGVSCKGKVTLTITDNQGRVRKRELNTLRMDVGDGDGPQRYMTYFKSPADVRKMVFLVHKTVEPGQDDARWLYMPGLDLVKRIAAGDKRTSFAGSDFLYEDISGRNLAEDRHEPAPELEANEDGTYVVRNTPLNPVGVEFTQYIAHIDKKTFLPMKVEYYKGDRIYRVTEILKVEDVAGHPTVTVSRVRNLETGSATVMTFSDVRYDLPLSESIFSERYLRRPPREILR